MGTSSSMRGLRFSVRLPRRPWRRRPRPSVQRRLQAPVAAEEVERGRGQLAVVARAHEALLGDVVVEDPGAREVLLRVEGIEHEDPAVAGEAAVVEEPELQVTHRHARFAAPEEWVALGEWW